MALFQGVVEKSKSRVWPNGTSYFFFLEGSDIMFKMGNKAPAFKEGGEISFEADENGSVKWASIKSLSHRAPEEAAPIPKAAPQIAQPVATSNKVIIESIQHAAGGPVATPIKFVPGFTLKDLSIVRQVAMKAAIEAVPFLVTSGTYALPKTKAKAFDAYIDLVLEITSRLYADLSVTHEAGVQTQNEVLEANTSAPNTDEEFQE